jgi:hypothetical protein
MKNKYMNLEEVNVIGTTAPFEKETYYEIVKYSERYKDYHNNIIVEIGSSDNSYYLNEPLCSKCPSNVSLIFATNTTVLNDRVIPIPTFIEDTNLLYNNMMSLNMVLILHGYVIEYQNYGYIVKT